MAKDFPPWSLIWGAQNKRHTEELRRARDELEACQRRVHHLALSVAETLLGTSSNEFNQVFRCAPAPGEEGPTRGVQGVWQRYVEVADVLTEEDIHAVLEAYLLKFGPSLVIPEEIHERADIMVRALKIFKDKMAVPGSIPRASPFA